MMIRIYQGFDPREAIAYHVCSQSIISRASEPLSITPLALNTLKGYHESHKDGSNDFIYSRFLVPHLQHYQGWSLYIDGDMVVNDDINNLWKLRDDRYAVMVVQHRYKTKAAEKYLGNKNELYAKKNWSSVILWNCSHPSNRTLTPEYVESATGKMLHQFEHLKDEEIGELPVLWNWLATEYPDNKLASLVHYTLGSMCFKEYANAPMSDLWWAEYEKAIKPLERNG